MECARKNRAYPDKVDYVRASAVLPKIEHPRRARRNRHRRNRAYRSGNGRTRVVCWTCSVFCTRHDAAADNNGLLSQTEEFYVITWTAKKEQIFEMPTGGAAIMREGPNLMKLARKEQCLALTTQLRTKFKTDACFYRVYPNGMWTARRGHLASAVPANAEEELLLTFPALSCDHR